MIPSPDKTVAKTAACRDQVGAWLIISAMAGLLLLQAVTPEASCCSVQTDHASGAMLAVLSILASGI